MVLTWIQKQKNKYGIGFSGSKAKKKREDSERKPNTTRMKGGRSKIKQYWNSSTKKWQSKPVPRGQNLPPSASEGKGKGPKSNPVGSKPNPKSAEDRYDPGDLTKNPNKAYHSPSLGRMVTGSQIKEKAKADRLKIQQDKEKNDRQAGLERAYDQGKADSKPQSKAPAEKSTPTTIFTKHYKTGKDLGVMSRSARRAYEKEAGTRTWESEKKRLGAKGNRQNTKASSKSWRKKQELKLAKKDTTSIKASKNQSEEEKKKKAGFDAKKPGSSI